MKISAFRGFAVACLATTAIVGLVQPAFAQIEEIVVTTRKRSENLQDVPIVVTAFTAENLERKGVGSLADVLKFTAGVQINEAFLPQDQRVVVRGLAPTRGRPNVAVLQDDIDISSESLQTAGGSLLINPRLFDIARVEIVKGPHSALYGRSAFAGAINYITKKPGEEFEGRAQLETGMRGKAEAKVSVSGPLQNSGISVGVNAAYWSFDGFHKNSVTNTRLGGYEGKGVGGSAVYNGSDTFKASARIEFTDDSSDPLARAVVPGNLNEAVPVQVRTDIAANLGGTPTGPAARGFLVSPLLTTFPIVNGAIPDVGTGKLIARVSPNPRTPGKDYRGVDRKVFRATLRMESEFSLADFTSLTHYGHGQTQQFLELANVGDVNAAKIAQEINFDTDTKLLSQEFRLQSNDEESPLKWTIGGLYWNEEADQLSRSVTCFTTFPTRVQVAPGVVITAPSGNPALNCGPFVAAVGTSLPSNPENWGRNTFHSSFYALVDFDVTEQFSVSAELRQTWEREHTKGPGWTHGIDPFGIISPGPGPIGCSPTPPAIIAPGCLTRDSGVILPNGQRDPEGSTAHQGILRTEDFWVPRVGLNYKATEDLLLYVSASKGVKPGGISTLGGGNSGFIRENLEYQQEKMWVYEAGWKANFADGKALLNGAVYYQDFTDKQASTQIVLANGILGTRIVNAAAARVKGIDLESAFQPTEELNLSIGYTWLDAKYKKFVVRTGGANPIVRSQSCTPVVTYRLLNGTSTTVVNPTALPAAGAVITARSCDVDKSGHILEFAPTNSLQLNALYKADIGGDMSWMSEFSVQAQSKRYTDDDQRTYLQGFWSADVRTGVESDTWSVTAYVDNVFNDDTIKGGLANTDFPLLSAIASPGPFTLVLPSNFTANLPDKRQFGIRASYKF
ncbi:MAG: TonB-dependent receptor [Rhodospirillaceae bacterium]|nr:TonB-dependent receptor [Rhodospirillaceae bacterium]